MNCSKEDLKFEKNIFIKFKYFKIINFFINY